MTGWDVPGAAPALPVAATDDFVELFRSQYPRVVRALIVAGADRWLAEETAQEAFARTFGHWRRVRGGTNPAGYVFRTAFRILNRRGLVPASAVDEAVGPPAAGADEQAAIRVDLARALAAMPPRRRACVILCWLADASSADAAEALGISAGTVRKQLELARRQLEGSLTA